MVEQEQSKETGTCEWWPLPCWARLLCHCCAVSSRATRSPLSVAGCPCWIAEHPRLICAWESELPHFPVPRGKTLRAESTSLWILVCQCPWDAWHRDRLVLPVPQPISAAWSSKANGDRSVTSRVKGISQISWGFLFPFWQPNKNSLPPKEKICPSATWHSSVRALWHNRSCSQSVLPPFKQRKDYHSLSCLQLFVYICMRICFSLDYGSLYSWEF